MTRLLLDTHILLGMLDRNVAGLGRDLATVITSPDSENHGSVASIWEIAIKTRLGKLALGLPLLEVPAVLTELKIAILPIGAAHALANVEPSPRTRDPFDRLLLAQCQVENMRLVTHDRALIGHPLAWQAS